MTFLASHLPFPSSPSTSTSAALPPPGTHLLISDTLKSPAHFAVYHIVAAALAQKCTVIWVDIRGEGRASLEAVLKKLGTSIPPPSSTSFVHVQPTTLPSDTTTGPHCPSVVDENGRLSLRPIYDMIASAMPASPTPRTAAAGDVGSVLILDGLSELLWWGFSPADVGRFVRASLSTSKQAAGVLISTIHSDQLPLTAASAAKEDGPANELLERLIRIGQGVWWRVSGLESGRSGDVHGEISVHPISPPSSGVWQDVPRSNPLQYRLEERGIKVFPKGTGRGFL